MNIKFDATNSKNRWEITDEKILYKGKEILLSEITYVSHHACKESFADGRIFIGCGNGFFAPSYSLYYKEQEIEQGEMVAEFLFRLIGNEQEADNILKQSENRRKKSVIKAAENELRTKEFKKRCTVCGNVFCYTWDDLQKNKELNRKENLNLVASLAGGLSGNYAAGAVLAQTADQAKSQIIDYEKCPSCGSRDLADITDEEIEQSKNPQNSQSISVVDELKNFKELLDSGIITQEEFDAKKKQLLGL